MDLNIWLPTFKHEGFADWFWWVSAWCCFIGGSAMILAPVIAAAAGAR